MRDAKILIVEDEIIIALDIKSKVENFGYRVVGIVNSGQKPFEKIDSLKPDLVLMDIVLFGAMDGIQTAESIRKRYRIPVVYLTAHADDQTLGRAMATEPFGYVVKPLKDRELLGAIEIALFKSRLEESQRNWEITFSSMVDWVCLLEPESRRIFESNGRGESFLGGSVRGIAGKDCCSLLHGSDKPIDGCPVQKMLETRKRESLEFRDTARGKWFEVTADPVTDESGSIKSAVHIVRDITLQKQGEAQLRSERNKLQSIFSALGEGMAIVDCDHNVEYQNEAGIRRLGDGIGRKCHETFFRQKRPCEGCPMENTLRTGRIQSHEIALPNGRHLEITFSHFTDAESVSKVVLLQKDVTDRKALQVEAVRAAHLQSLGELAAGVAHEINNPIMGIINCAQLIADRVEPDDPGRELSGRIMREGDRIARIVKNLLAFARNNKEEKASVALRDVLDDTLGLLGNQLRKDAVDVRIVLPESLPRIWANRYQIQQVFLNLLANAGYALNEKFSQAHPDKVIEIRGSETRSGEAPFVRTEFIDSGTGIPAAILDRVCDPFFTTKRTDGTGLGLSICHNIIREHGGNLHLESEEGKYTKITVDLPVNGGNA
jgi:PAS domain S-box-containing protein